MNSYKKRIFGSALGRRFKSTGAAIAILASFAFALVEVPAEERAQIEKAIDGNRNLLY